jgi:hypothetical protein
MIEVDYSSNYVYSENEGKINVSISAEMENKGKIKYLRLGHYGE